VEEYTKTLALEPRHFKALFNRGFSYDKVRGTAGGGVRGCVCSSGRGSASVLRGHGSERPSSPGRAAGAASGRPPHRPLLTLRAPSPAPRPPRARAPQLGQYELAVADYSAALSLCPDNSFALYNRGITKDRMGDYPGAVEDFTAAAGLDPTNADFYHNRGFSLRKQGRFEAAIADYTRAIELNPGHCRAYYNRAFSRDRLGRCEEAIADYSRALEIEPGNPAALHNRGSLYERLGRCGGGVGSEGQVKNCPLSDDGSWCPHRRPSRSSSRRRSSPKLSIFLPPPPPQAAGGARGL
jgi:hypothetical protein